MEAPDGIPSGFAGTAETLESRIPDGAQVLRMPSQGVADGPFVRLPEGPHEVILIESFAESLGNLERFLCSAAEQLVEGGLLLIDVENEAAPRALRCALEGRHPNTEPAGSFANPERRVQLKRVLDAVAAAGLLVDEVYGVPSRDDAVGPEFLRTMLREGFLPLPYLGGTPAVRFWIEARKSPTKAGTIVLLGGEGPARQASCAQIMEFLPEDWELLGPEGDNEAEACEVALAESVGQLIWFLRAGTEVDAELFAELSARLTISPAAPAAGGELVCPGDINGLMVSRRDLFLVGRLVQRFRCPQIAYEDWLLRLEARTRRCHEVTGHFVPAALPIADPALLAEESAQLLELWRGVELDPSGFASQDNPNTRARNTEPPPWIDREPRVSLCMIARDEERFLGQCLESVRGFVDEIILVDTGSQDRTVAIAEQYGARVLHFDWCDDFAAARNVALEAATGDWVLSLDADEALRPEGRELFRTLVQDPGVSGYHLRFDNHHTAAKTNGVLMIRLFRRLEGLEWQNRIHEQITTSLVECGRSQGLGLSICEVWVDHYGYLDEVMESRDKTRRNDALFKQHLDEQPDDVYMLYKYGDFLRRETDRWDESLRHLERALRLLLEMPPARRAELPYAAEIAALCALELRRADRCEEADRVVDLALRNFAATPNLHYIAAGLAQLRGSPDEAIAHYQACLSYRDQILVVPVQEGVTGHVALAGIAQSMLLKQDYVQAGRILEQARRLDPDYEVSALLQSRLHLECGDLGGALGVLTKYLEARPSSAGACHQAALILKELGHEEQAQAMAQRAIDLFEAQSLSFEAQKVREAVFAVTT